MITVFTPTYNREKELPRVYQALLTQKFSDFEWLIIDDGSKDNTSFLVAKFIAEGKINIRYIKQTNAGKSAAYNHGVKEAKGELFICCDSDDYLEDNILEEINKDYLTIKNDQHIAGIGYIDAYNGTNEIIGTKYPKDIMQANYYDIYHKYHVKGDKQLMFKTSILRATPFPMFEKEKFVPEALIFLRIAANYDLLLCNKIGEHIEYLENGYTDKYFELVKKNPLGNRLYYLELYKWEPTIYNAYAYNLFSYYGKVNIKETFSDHPGKFKVLLTYLPTKLIGYIRRNK